MQYDFTDELNFPLPESFHFVKPQDIGRTSVGKCCWKGFDHEQRDGLWNHQYEQHNYILSTAPHVTLELDVVIADGSGEYACYAGMWWHLKIIWHIWNLSAPFLNTGIKVS